MNFSRSMSMKSEAEEKTTEILKKLGKIPYFLDVIVKQDTPKKKTDINVSLTKFILAFNFSTYIRFMKFLDKIQKYQNKILIPTQPIPKNNLNFKEKLNVIESKKEEYVRKGVKKDFMPKLLDKIKDRKQNNTKNDINENPNNLDNECDIKYKTLSKNDIKSVGEKSVYSKRQSIMQDNLHMYRKEIVRQKLKFSFEMKQIELNIPLDAESDRTKAIVFNFNMMLKLKQINESENYYDKSSNNLVIQNYLKKNLFVNMMIFNIDFDMYNVANQQILFNLLNEKILSNSRITIFVKSFLLPEKNSEIMTVEFKVEPITMIIGFRQVRILKDLMENLNNSLYPKKQEEDEYFKGKPKELTRDNYKIHELDSQINSKEKIQVDTDKLLNLSEYSDDKNLSKKNISQYDDALSKKLSKIEKKIENQIKYNTALFNQLMDINFVLEKGTIKLIDNTGDYERPLTMIELSKISLKMITNSNPYDVDNMCQAIVEMLSERKPENLNISNLYMFMDTYFTIEMSSFNERVSDWEPILEPWSGNFRIEQIDKITRKKLEFRSDFIMNFNLSVQSVEVLNSILKKINQNETNWKKEEMKNSQLMANSVENTREHKNIIMKKKIDTSLLIENRSGVDLSFYFLANEKKSYNLMNKYQKSFTKNELSSIYQNLTDEIVVKKKDKFAFSFDGIPYLLDELDFSYNHFIIKKIPIYKENICNDSTNIKNDKFIVKESKKNNELKEKLLKSDEKSLKKDLKNKKDDKNNLKTFEENDLREIEKFIEVSIKIKNNGLLKVISIESNINIFNNTCFKSKLYFFNTKANEIEEIYKNGKIDISKCSGVVGCDPHIGVQIPLNYIIEPHLVFLATNLDVNNNTENFNMIFSDFNHIYSIGEEFNRLVNKKDLEDETQKNLFNKNITKEKCMQIKFENESKIVIFSLDILMLKTKSLLITNFDDSEDENIKKDRSELFYYQLILNPPIIMENKIPFDLNVNFEYPHNRMKNEISNNDVIHLNSDKFENSIFVLPLDKHKIYNFDMEENSVNCTFSMNYQNQYKYFTKEISSKDFIEQKNYLNFNYNNNEKDHFEMIVELQKLPPTKFFDYNFLNVESFFTKSRNFVFYFDYILINRLEENVFIRSSNLKLNEEDKFIEKDLVCFNLQSKALNIFSTPRNNSKAKIRIGESDWSDIFDLAAHGIEAGNSVIIQDKENKENKETPSIIYEFATIVTSSNNFNYSTVMVIEPRHVMVNKTGIDLKFRQVLGKNSYSKETQFILNDTEKVVKLNKTSEKNSKNIQFFIGKGYFDNEDHSDDFWSQKINIDNLQEYNIALYIPNYFDFNSYSKIDPTNNKIYQYDNKCKYLLVRVVIQTMDNGLIYIMLTQPKFPQFLIKNSTKEYLKIKQQGTNQILKIDPEKIVPYTLKDFSIGDSSKIVELEIFNKKTILNLDLIEATNEIILDKEKDIKPSLYYTNYNSKDPGILNIEQQEKENEKEDFINSLKEVKVFFSVSTDNKNITRIININTNFDDVDGLMEVKNNIISKRLKSTVINFKLKLKGIGLSIIDSFPKEVFYISFYNLKVILRNYVTKDGFIISKYANYVIYLKNFQVDYCLEGSFKQIIYPKIQYIPFKENEIDKKEYVEYVKILITQANCTNLSNDSETEKLAQFEFLLQEFNVKIDQKVINVLLDLVGQFLNRLDFYKEDAANAINEDIFDEEDEEIQLITPKNLAEQGLNYMRNNLNKEDMKILLPKNEFVSNSKKNFILTPKNISRKSTSGLENYIPEPNMALNIPNYEDVLKISDESGIYNIGNLTLSGIKINLTLRIDISSLEISLVPAFVTKLLGTVGNAIARITDSPLSFKELRISNVYNNMGYILACIIGKYKSQGILQIYKIIGSSDLIGNPVGLVGKIGTGFTELFNEPRKGFVNGPIHFGTGVAKGVNALVSNVVGGGLDVVGKITGTLYNATK